MNTEYTGTIDIADAGETRYTRDSFVSSLSSGLPINFTGTGNRTLFLTSCGGFIKITNNKTNGNLALVIMGFDGKIVIAVGSNTTIAVLHINGGCGLLDIGANTITDFRCYGFSGYYQSLATYTNQSILGNIGGGWPVENSPYIIGNINGSRLDAIKARTDSLTFTGANVNAESKVTAAPTDMALNSTVAKDATVGKPGTAQTISSNSDITAIKAKTDSLSFTGTDVKATLDGELVTLAATQGSYAPAKAGDAMALTSGERTSLAGVIWNSLTSGMTTVGSIGKKLADKVS